MTERIIIKKDEWGYIDDRPTYSEIVSTFGEIKVAADSGSYQGDSLYLIEKDDRYGIVSFGWGSCSGCDALEACDSQEDIDRLQDDLERGIKWFDYDDAVLEYLIGGGFKDSFLSAGLVIRFAHKAQEAFA